MGKHRATKEGPRWPRLLGGRPPRDDLFERSFRFCAHCGEEVYVLATDCRGCGQPVELRAS